MRKKSRWALLVVSLSVGMITNSASAETKTGLLDSLRLPSIFGGAEKEATTATPKPATPNRTPRGNAGILRPGNASSGAISSAKNQPERTASAEQGSNTFLPSLSKTFGNILGTPSAPEIKQPTTHSADGIAAPPPPTLEVTKSETALPRLAAPNLSLPAAIAKQPKIARPEIPPAVTQMPEAISAAQEITEQAPKRISQLAAQRNRLQGAEGVSPVAQQRATETSSSRRAWQKSGDNQYRTEPEPPTAQTNANLQMCELIDRTKLPAEAEDDTELEIPTAQQTMQAPISQPQAIEIPEPVIAGNEAPAPVQQMGIVASEERTRISTAARMAKPLATTTSSFNTTSEYTPNPAVITFPKTGTQPTTESEVKPASYELPPIITAAEARRLQAQKEEN